jgi:leucyl-tRNA synthetase
VPWPEVNAAALARDEIEVVLQVNGKVRGHVMTPVNLGREELERHALASEQVQKYAAGKTIRKVIVVPGKLVNIVVG